MCFGRIRPHKAASRVHVYGIPRGIVEHEHVVSQVCVGCSKSSRRRKAPGRHYFKTKSHAEEKKSNVSREMQRMERATQQQHQQYPQQRPRQHHHQQHQIPPEVGKLAQLKWLQLSEKNKSSGTREPRQVRVLPFASAWQHGSQATLRSPPSSRCLSSTAISSPVRGGGARNS